MKSDTVIPIRLFILIAGSLVGLALSSGGLAAALWDSHRLLFAALFSVLIGAYLGALKIRSSLHEPFFLKVCADAFFALMAASGLIVSFRGFSLNELTFATAPFFLSVLLCTLGTIIFSMIDIAGLAIAHLDARKGPLTPG